MKFLVILCLLVLTAAEEDSQETLQNDNNQNNNKPTAGEQGAQPLTGHFPSSAITFVTKENVNNHPLPNFGNAAAVHATPDLLPVTQVTPTLFNFSQGITKTSFPSYTQPGTNGVFTIFPQGLPSGNLPTFSQIVPPGSLPTFPQGVSGGNLPAFPQGVSSGSLPTFPQGISSGSLPVFSQGVPSGNLPAFAQGVTTGPLPTFPSGITTGTLPNFRQGVTNGAISNLTPIPRIQGTSIPSTYYVPAPVNSVVGGLGNPFNTYNGGVYSGLHGATGIPVNTFNGNNGNVAYNPLVTAPYRVLPQETLAGFSVQGLQNQAVSTSNALPPFTSNLLSTVPNGVFSPSQAVLKTPVTGTTQGGSLNLSGPTTGNVSSEPSENVFRRA